MEQKIILLSGEVFLTDEPERARELADSGFCVITLAGLTDNAAAYVETENDFDQLNDEFIARTLARYKGLPYVLLNEPPFLLREAEAGDYEYVMKLLDENRQAVMGYDGELWTDDIISARQFEKTIREYYQLFDFGLWILEINGRKAGIFGLSAEEGGVEAYYVLNASLRGQGIAKRVMQFVLNYARDELGIERIFIRTTETNKPSRALAEGLGFILFSCEEQGTSTVLIFIKELE